MPHCNGVIRAGACGMVWVMKFAVPSTNMLIAVELAERHGLEHMNTVEVEHFKVLTRSIDERKGQIEHVLADLSVQPDGSGFPHRAAPPLQ